VRWERLRRRRVVVDGHRVSEAQGKALARASLIELRGYFQRFEYYRDHRERIARWFERPAEPLLPDDTLTIHVRSGDVWQPGSHPGYPALPFSYYRGIVDERPWRRVHVVSESAADPLARALLALPGVEFAGTSLLGDFDFLRRSRHIALSVSTFGWWAAWLSQAESIRYPLVGLFDPGWSRSRSRRGHVDLAPRGDPRYRFVELPAQPPWQGTATDRERVLST
jgi:hypothetical protein